uniref:ATP-dependent Clp protease proteolytic subunit 1 n=1 Tax=Silene lithophila TaxID=2764677 RepID=UPI0027AB6A12|nr:ATP-dependent Clp protease proteolytic subunit 1 [Silene lithophila]WFF47438.1 ATP-dependent Clp protease proteolytic subunit 1 [Silene lithophila]
MSSLLTTFFIAKEQFFYARRLRKSSRFKLLVLWYISIRIMMHQPLSAYFGDTIEDFIADTAFIKKFRYQIAKSFSRRTGKPTGMVYQDLERDGFMSAEEAQAHGIIDRIATGKE